MCFNILLMIGLLFSPSLVQIDRIVASVDSEIITHSDMDRAIAFYLFEQQADEGDGVFSKRVITNLVHYKIVVLEFQEEIILQPDDYEAIQAGIIRKCGSWEQFQALLAKFHWQWKNFQHFIREKVFFEKAAREKIQLNIQIQFNEIEKFYREDYLPEQEKLGFKPKSLIEMSPLIENHLRLKRTDQELETWLREIQQRHKIEYNLEEKSP